MDEFVIMPKAHWVAALNEVRAKGGTSNLILSGELATVLQGLSGDTSIFNSLVDRTIKKVESDTEVVGQFAFCFCTSLTEIILPRLKNCGTSAFQNCSSLESIVLPEIQTIGGSAFVQCTKLKTIDFPKVMTIDGLAFRYCTALTSVHFPNVTTVGAQSLQNCTGLTRVRLDSKVTINNLSFGQCSKFVTLILTSTDDVSTLANTTAFSETPIASGTGYIYVPRSLIDSYKSATNWSTYANQFRAIEDYPDILN